MSYLFKVHLNFQGQKVKEVYKNKIQNSGYLWQG